MAEHNKLGCLGEDVAADYLEEQGYVIRERNWRQKHLELDIVAEKDGELVIVEVKTRTDTENGDPLDAMHSFKRRHLLKATDAYVKKHNLSLPLRFDVITLVGDEKDGFQMKHIENAFYAY